MLDVLKIRTIFVQDQHGSSLFPLAEKIDSADEKCGAVNLLLKREDGWYGYNTLWRAGVKALEAELSSRSRSLKSQNVLVIGNGGLAQSIAQGIAQRQGLVSVCGPDDREARQRAEASECRFVPFQNLYETLADIIVIADARVTLGVRHGQLNPSLFRPTMTVLDLANLPAPSPILEEAQFRGCRTIDRFSIYRQQIETQFKAITGQALPEQALAQGVLDQ
jgi:shikimate 5-dehydrogenase